MILDYIFARKKMKKKIDIMVFLQRSFEKKNTNLACFSYLIPLSQNRVRVESPWLRKLHKQFVSYILD